MTHVTKTADDLSANLTIVATQAIETADRARRYHRIELLVVLSTVAILLVAILLGAVFVSRQADLRRETAEHTDCVIVALATFTVDNDTNPATARDAFVRAVDAC